MSDSIFDVNPFILFFIGLVAGYIIRLIILEKLFKNTKNANSESILDIYYDELKKRSIKELTAREYQHLSMFKKIEFEKKHPQQASSKIAVPISKVFTIHSVFPEIYSKSKVETKNRLFMTILFLLAILFLTGILIVNFKIGL